MNKQKFEAIKDELYLKGYDKDLIIICQRVKRNNFFQSAVFGPMKTGILTIKQNALTFFPLKKGAVVYENIYSFTLDSIVPDKCSFSGYSHSPTLGVLTIKHINKNKDEFFFSKMLYYDTLKAICSIFFGA